MKKVISIHFLSFFAISVLFLMTSPFALATNETKTIRLKNNNPYSLIETYTVDSDFIMKGKYYRGADRKYSGNYLTYTVIITDSNGNPVDKQVSVQLWDYNHSSALHTNVVNANGEAITTYSIPIVSNRMYYFKYYLANGSSSNLKIRMIINDWS